MGKRLRVQRRGRGSSTFRASTHKRVASSKYAYMEKFQEAPVFKAKIEELLHEPGRGAPLVKSRLESGEVFHVVAPEGIEVGQEIQIGPSAQPAIGNIMPIGDVPPGAFLCNLELRPGDGGKLVRASGTYASLVSHTSEGTLIKLPSGKSMYLDDLCLATIGVTSGAGRTDKPFLKAGKAQAWMNAKGASTQYKGSCHEPSVSPTWWWLSQVSITPANNHLQNGSAGPEGRINSC